MTRRIFGDDATDAGVMLVITAVILVGGVMLVVGSAGVDRVLGWVMVGGALLALPFNIKTLRGIAKRRQR